MTKYERQTWTHLRDPLGSTYEDIDLVRCVFDGCSLGQLARHPSQRTVIRRVRAIDCKVDGGSVGPVLFDDVQITNLRAAGNPLWLYSPLFRHVVIDGKVSSICLTHERWGALLEPTDECTQEDIAFDAAAATFYTHVDWALDISRAQFTSLDWRLDVPSRLVRRDPETQVVIKRERAIEERWRKVPLHMIVSIALENFVQFGQSEMILAASKASKRFKDELESIQALRKEGIAEPD